MKRPLTLLLAKKPISVAGLPLLLLCSAWLMSASVAGADCGWVLWGDRDFKHMFPLRGFESIGDCLAEARSTAADLARAHKMGHATGTIVTFRDEDGTLVSAEYVCLPANIDPRK